MDEKMSYRARVMYPINDKYKFCALELIFDTKARAKGWADRYCVAQRTVIEIKEYSGVEPYTLAEWAASKRPDNCPEHLFVCEQVVTASAT